jgi:hypothetical protein
MKVANDKIVDAGSMGADITSDAVLIDQLYGFSLQSIYTGSPVGDLIFQVSNDDVTIPSQVVNWNNLASAVAIAAVGTNLQNFIGTNYKWLRVFFDRTSGTGSLTVTLCGKG